MNDARDKDGSVSQLTAAANELGPQTPNSPDDVSPGRISPSGVSRTDVVSPRADFGTTRPRAVDYKNRHGLAITWWTTCTVWGYFVFGELVVATSYPEALAAVGVVAGLAAAGRRASSLFDDSRAVVIGLGITMLLSIVCALAGPALLLTLVDQRYVALVGLLITITVALAALRLIRRGERAARVTKPSTSALPSVLAWVFAFVFTAVAVTLAAQA